jgi:hypothetical protein
MKKPKIYNPGWANYMKFWSVAESPWRPSKKDVAFCEKMVKNILRKEKKPKALIFGSTPEIRDLLAKYKIETISVDINLGMRTAMNRMMKYENLKEKFIKANWLTVKLPKNYFDLVFDDGCLCNLEFKTWPIFLSQVEKSIKRTGLYYSAEWIYQIKNPWTFKDLIEKYKKDYKYFSDFKNRIWSLHRLMYEPGLYNKGKKELYFYKIMDRFKDLVKEGIITDSDVKKIQWTKYDIGNYTEIAFDSIEENDKIIKKYFKIVSIQQDKSHPIMAFRRDYMLMKRYNTGHCYVN